MKLFTAIAYILSLVFISEASFALAAQEKKKKKKTDEEKTEVTKPDKASSVKLTNLFLEAEKLKVTEDWESAISTYREVLKIDPSNHNAHFQIAQIYINQNKAEDAEIEAKEAVKGDASNRWYLETLAAIYMAQGKTKEATETYKNMIQKFPNNPETFLNLGYMQARAGQFDAAIKTYDQYEKLFGMDESVVLEKKNMYLRLNKFNDAVGEMHKLVEAFPGEVDYLLMEAELYRANRMKDKATALYKRILELEPENAQALLALADLDSQGGNAEQSLESLKKIFENPKTDVDTKIKILFPYLQYWEVQKAKKQDAFDLAEILTATHPEDPKAFAIKGDLYYFDSQFDKALASYKRAIELNKDVLQVWQQILVIYNTQRDWANLQKTATEALEYFPNQAVVYLFKGGAEQQNKEYEKAVSTLLKGEKMTADNEKLRAQFWANIGDVYHSLNKYVESDSAYDRSLKHDAENAYVLNNYSYYLSLRKQNLEKAKQMSAYSNKLEPNNSSFLDTYAWILVQLNDFAGAKEWQEKAMKAGGDKSGTILEHYGDILFHLGSKDEALNYWKQAKELGTDSGTIDRKIAEGKYIE
ncbi:MAG: tetratricopeptide repeat protein [Bacteroidota bacterium]